MNKKRATRRKPSLYKIPFKSKISTQEGDSKITIEEKRQLTNDASNNVEKTATITDFKANMHQKKSKQLKRQKIKEQDEGYFKYENTSTASSNSGIFSETTVIDEGSKIKELFKDDEKKVANFSELNNCNASNSIIHSNDHDNVKTNNCKLIVDVNLVMDEIINNVSEKELKLATFQQLQFGKYFYEQKNDLQTDADLPSIITNSCSSNIKDPERENQHMKDSVDSPSNKTKENEKEPRDLNYVEDPKNTNYNDSNDDFKYHTESTGFKTVDKDNIKRKIEQEVENYVVSKNLKHKKKKMDNNISHAESKCINGSNDTFQNRTEILDSFHKIGNENGLSSEFIADESYVFENSTSKENQPVSDTHSSNFESNTTSNLNSLKKDKNISMQVIVNPTEHFEENFSDLKSDITSMPGLLNTEGSIKKALTIPCMSALSYLNTLLLTEMEDPTKTDKNSKLSSSPKELNNSHTGNLHTDKTLVLQKDLNETEFANGCISTKFTNKNKTKHPNSEKAISFCTEIYKNEDLTSNTFSLTQTETNYNLDKAEQDNLQPSNMMNIIPSISNLKTHNNSDNGLRIFNEEEFITEKIIFREKEESDENDVIPTGMFKHLNEIFEYNNETTSIDLKSATPTKMDGCTSEDYITNPRKYENFNEEMKMGETMLLINNKDFTTSINNDSSKQENLKFRETSDVNLNRNEEKSDKKINLSNSTNTIQENNDNIKVSNNEESLKLNDSKEKFITNVEGRCAVEVTESSTNKAEDTPKELCFTQSNKNEEKYFSDFDNCMEMDDDFDLTASQLNMLDVNEKMQSTNKINAEQQTDISNSIFIENDLPNMYIVKELHSLRESIESLKEKLDELSSSKETNS